MNRALWIASIAALSLSACVPQGKSLIGDGGGGGGGLPPFPHLPGKTDLVACNASACDRIPIYMQADARQCSAMFFYRRVIVQGGQTARFGLVPLTGYLYRFTDPTSNANTSDSNAHKPGIDIDYGGDSAVFKVGYPDVGQIALYAVDAFVGITKKGKEYPFKIHTEWSVDGGRTWGACTEIDPVIAND